MNTSTPTETPGWIEWNGGECPLPPGTRYERRYRSGAVQTATIRADAGWNAEIWSHERSECDLDIIAYRIVELGK